MTDAVIVSAVRTAVGKAPAGTLRGTRPDELAATVIKEALRRAPGGAEWVSMVPLGGNKVSPNPSLVDSYPDVYLTTGLVAENHARESSISREEQDAFALRSHQRAVAAIDAGRFAGEITPLTYRVAVPRNGNGRHDVRELTFNVNE